MEYDANSVFSILAAGRENLRRRGLPSDYLGEENFPHAHRLNREFFKTIGLKTRLIGTVEADTATEWFGTPLRTPVFASGISYLSELSPQPIVEVARGVGKAGSCLAVGVQGVAGSPDLLKAACETGTPVIQIIKPLADEDVIYGWLERAEAHGCMAVGMDLISCTGTEMARRRRSRISVKVKTREQLRDYISSTPLPFLVKGVLSVEDGLQAQSLGAAGVIVPNLGGWALDGAVHALEVLPDIRSAVGRGFSIFVDGGFLRGTDVLKALALGADGVGMGTAVALAYAAKGSDGVADLIACVSRELEQAMTLCGCPRVSEIDKSVLHARSFRVP